MMLYSRSQDASLFAPLHASLPRVVLPNLITVLALCSGMTAVKMAFEARYELAVIAILVAAALDALDGRVARLVNGASKFGEQLDSLADAISFGVAPALLLYFWSLATLGPLGWIVALSFAVAIVLRLARFNVGIADAHAAGWRDDFFCGMPAPAAAVAALLPVYLTFGAAPVPPLFVALYVAAIAALAISRVPFYSGKKSGFAILRRHPAISAACIALCIVLLALHFWATLAALLALYLAAIPLGMLHYRRVASGQEAGENAIGQGA